MMLPHIEHYHRSFQYNSAENYVYCAVKVFYPQLLLAGFSLFFLVLAIMALYLSIPGWPSYIRAVRRE